MSKRRKFFISVGDILRSKSYREGRFFGGVRRFVPKLTLDKQRKV